MLCITNHISRYKALIKTPTKDSDSYHLVSDSHLPRYLMAALVIIRSSKLEVPPKLFTARATSIPTDATHYC